MRDMTDPELWKNFSIGREVQISGNYIYDGILVFEQMEHFNNEDEIFEFLYFISVGLERLMKANIILIEHSEKVNQDKLEKSLITHNHSDLLHRILAKHSLKLGKVHNAFIQMLAKFYKTCRYDRFSLSDFRNYDKEKKILVDFLNNYSEIEVVNEPSFGITANNLKFKKFIGKVIGKIVTQLYDILRTESSRIGLFTYEIRTFSKAFKIFIEEDFTFHRERILQKEILVYLLQKKDDTGFKNHTEQYLPALEFENGSENDYSKPLMDLSKCSEFLDELEARYDDLEDVKHRFEAIEVIGNSNINFEKDMECKEDEE